MTKEEIIRNLKYTMEKYKNDTVGTFGTNISVMCKDILDYLEQKTKTGHWISMETEKICSNCGWSHSLVIPKNYCPNCGAKMVEPQESEE